MQKILAAGTDGIIMADGQFAPMDDKPKAAIKMVYNSFKRS